MAVLVLLVVFKFWWLLAALASPLLVGRLIGGWFARRDDWASARRRADAELCARADQQHHFVLAGDDRGIYGEYPPVA
jgi:hypothetical protein